MFDLSSLFPPQEQAEESAPSRGDVHAALGRMVGDAGNSVPKVRKPSVEDLSALVGPRAQRESTTFADLSRLVGDEPAVAKSNYLDISVTLTQRVGLPDLVDEGGWQSPGAAQPARRPRFSGRRAFGSVNALSVAVAVAAIAILCGSVGLAVAQRVTSDPAAEALASLREREGELHNESQVLTTARGLYTASLSDAGALAEATNGILGELVGIVDQAGLQPVDSARSTLVAAIASAPSISVPEYRRSVIDDGSVADIAAAIDDVQAAKIDIAQSITDARAARSAIVAALDSLGDRLREMDASIDTAAAEANRSHTAASEGFRSAVTDAAARVRAAHEGGRDGVAEMSEFAAAVTALRAENERVLEQRRSGSGDSGVRTPYVPGGSSPSGGTGTGTDAPPASDSDGTSDPGGGSSDSSGGTPSPDPSTAPPLDPSPPSDAEVPPPTP